MTLGLYLCKNPRYCQINMKELEGKVAVVTGGSRGIGKAVVETLLENGAKVAFNSRDPEGKEGKQLVEKYGENILWVPGDMLSVDTCEQLVKETKAKFSGIHILVCCTGTTADGPFLRMSNDKFDNIYKLKADSARIMTQKTLFSMKQDKWGRIVYMSSVAADGSPMQVNYAMANGALESLAKSTALIYPDIISANVIRPALVNTDMASTQRLPTKYRDEIISQMPIGRILEPQEIADAVLMLVSQKTPAINGQIIDVDGGMRH